MDASFAHPRAAAPAEAEEVEFSERAFFLKAFQGICLTFVLSQSSDLTPPALALLQQVLQEVLPTPRSEHRDNGRVLLLFHAVPAVTTRLQPLFSALSATVVQIDPVEPRHLPPALWQVSHQKQRPALVAIGVEATTPQAFAEKIGVLALLLRMSRLVWVDAAGGIPDGTGQTVTFLNSTRLADILRGGDGERIGLLKLFQTMLVGGVKAISLCRLTELDQELFTYQGMGSFFSRRPYCQVRRLGLDDFELAAALLRKGEQEGFLLPRSDGAVAQVLTHSYGAFILENRLAGICALETTAYQAEQAGEIVSLYTLTRFQGVGVGGQLLNHVVRDAKRRGLSSLFACTRHPRVADFFLRCRFGRQRNHFHRVGAEQVPAAKWHAYDPDRQRQIICLCLPLGEPL
ncbi:MAG: GNAT family N-acetyltransferase [Magnetococcales bacterium]|nr:GNAT family N-acetyltransferase [Magnetococcales bacterium]